MSKDDTSDSESPSESSVRGFLQRWFPWLLDGKVAVGMLVLVVLTSIGTFGALGYYSGSFSQAEEYPPGTNESGINDSDLLVEQHAVALTNSDYRATLELSFARGDEKEQNVSRIFEHDVDEEILIGNVTTPRVSYDVYNSPKHNATYYKVMRQSGNASQTSYEKSSRDRKTKFAARKFFKQRLPLFNTTAQGYEKLDDGTRVRRFNITGFNQNASKALNTSKYTVDGSFVITDSGVIRSYEATVRGENVTADGKSFVQRESFTVERVELMLNNPDWLSEAINQTGKPTQKQGGEEQNSTDSSTNESETNSTSK